MILALAAGCEDEPLTEPLASLSFRFESAPMPVDGRCTASSPSPLSGDSGDLVRLTYRDPSNGTLICDAVVEFGAPGQVVAVPERSRVSVIAEQFRDGALVAQGAVADANLSNGDVTIGLAAAERFSCAQPMTGARAFASATRLPTDQVLIIGGLIAPGDRNSVVLGVDGSPLLATASVELYTPGTGFETLDVPGLLPRAFHEAYVAFAPDGGPVRIAVVGGLTVAGNPAETAAVLFGQPGAPLRFVPAPAAQPAPTEMITFDPATRSIKRELIGDSAVPRLMAAVATAPSAPPVVVGGWAAADRLATVDQLDVLERASARTAGSAPAAASRVGATATAIDSERVLIWGGHLAQNAPDPVMGAAEVATLGPPPVSTPFAPGPGSALPDARAFHAAARDEDGSILLAGGFAIGGGVAIEPAGNVVQQVTFAGAPMLGNVPLAGDVPTPVGYLTASALDGGGVLLAGGSPGSAACGSQFIGVDCAVDRAYLLRPGADELVEVADGLIVERYGHSALTLSDGTVVVLGGIRGEQGVAEVLREAESFNPASALRDPLADVGIERAPGDIARDGDGDPLAPCGLLQAP